MSDINQQSEELARIMKQVNQDMAAYGQITKATADQKRDAEIQAATGMKNFTKASGTAADAVGHLATAGMAAGKAMLEGKKGAAAFNESIDGLTKAATAAGVALTLLVPGGVIIKGLVAGFTAVTAATAGMVKASNEMADKIYKGYSGLAKSGAAASDGMTGVFNDAKKLGLSMNELDQLVGLVGESSQDLALFAGSVFEGRKKFAEMGEAMEPYRQQMIAAGLTQEEINQGAMSYIRLQTRLGQSQNKTTTELAEGARKYLIEQDALTKLVGATRQEQEAMRQEALTEQMFAAQIRELQLKGDEKSLKAAEELQQANIMASKVSKEFGASFRASVTGNLLDPAAQKLNMAAQGAQFEQIERLKEGTQSAAGAITEIGKSIGKSADGFALDLAKLNVSDEFMLSYGEMQKIRIATEGDLVANLKKIDQDQKEQGLKGGKGADDITNQYAKNITQQQKLNEKFERTVFAGIPNSLEITNKLGNATETLATGFEKLGGAVNRLLRLVGLGEKVDKGAEKQTEISDVAKKLESALAAQKTASTPEQKAAAEREVKFYEEKKKVLEQEHKVILAQDKNAKLDAQILDRAKDEIKIKKAAYDKAMETATVSQKMGFGLDKDQQKAKKELFEAYANERALRQNEGGARTKAREAAAVAQPAAPGAAPAAGAPRGGGAAAPAAPVGGGRGSVNPPVVGLEGGGESGRMSDELTKSKIDDILSFTERSGSKSAFEGLDQTFKNAVIRAAEEYNAVTGKTIQINSAKRDPKDQERLYAETVAAGRPGVGPTGMAVAKPGRSLHERGHAVDIQQYKDPAAIAAFNKQGLSQKVAGDPVHFQARNGGVFSGPDSGYQPSITMHGTEAIIPLKDGAVPVRLFGDETASAETSSGMPDFGSMLNSLGSTMFAAIQTLQPEAIDSKFDREMRQEVIEPVEADNETASEVFDTPMASEPTGIMEFLKEAKEANFAMLSMISELVREQRNANDISTRILQVSSN